MSSSKMLGSFISASFASASMALFLLLLLTTTSAALGSALGSLNQEKPTARLLQKLLPKNATLGLSQGQKHGPNGKHEVFDFAYFWVSAISLPVMLGMRVPDGTGDGLAGRPFNVFSGRTWTLHVWLIMEWFRKIDQNTSYHIRKIVRNGPMNTDSVLKIMKIQSLQADHLLMMTAPCAPQSSLRGTTISDEIVTSKVGEGHSGDTGAATGIGRNSSTKRLSCFWTLTWRHDGTSPRSWL